MTGALCILLFGLVCTYMVAMVWAKGGILWTWNMVLVITLWAAVLRSSPAVPALSGYLTAAYVLGLLLLAALGLIRPRSGTNAVTRAPTGALCSFWLLFSVALALSFITADTRDPASIAGFLLVGAVVTAASTTRWRMAGVLALDAAVLYVSAFAVLMSSLLIGLVAKAGGGIAAFNSFGGLQGLFSNPNFLAVYACVTMPLAAHRLSSGRARRRLFHLTVLLVASGAVLMSQSRAGLIAGGLGVLLVVIWDLRLARVSPAQMMWWIAALFVLVLSGAHLASFMDRSARGSDFSTGRLGIWKATWEASTPWGSNLFPVTDSWEYLPSGELARVEYIGIHNLFLKTYAGVGILGVVLILALIASVFVGSTDRDLFVGLSGASAAILTFELTESTLLGFGGPAALFAWVTLFATATVGRSPRRLGKAASPAPLGHDIPSGPSVAQFP